MDRRAWLRAQPWFTPGAGGADEPIFEGRCTFERDAARPLAFRAPLLGAATATPLALALAPASLPALGSKRRRGADAPARLFARFGAAGSALHGTIEAQQIVRIQHNLGQEGPVPPPAPARFR